MSEGDTPAAGETGVGTRRADVPHSRATSRIEDAASQTPVTSAASTSAAKRSATADRWIDATIAAISLSLAVSQFFVHRLMSGFDSGVYFGAASQVVAGHMPYRDFVLVQPPAIVVLLAPWALVGRLSTLTLGFTLARVCSAVVVAAVAVVIGRLLRPYGRAAALLGGVAVALSPTAVFEMTAVKLESYCLLLCLLGAVAVVRAEVATARRARQLVAVAGVVMGVALAVKLWALLLLVALAVGVWRVGRPLLWRFVAATVIGFSLVAGPFFLLAPSEFIRQVIIAQLTRRPNVLGAVSTVNRLSELMGLRNTPLALTRLEIYAVCAVAAGVVLAGLFLGGRRRVIDDYLLVASALTLTALLASKEFYNYYGYFWTPLMVGVIVSSVVRIARGVALKRQSTSGWSTQRRPTVAGRILGALLIAVAIPTSVVVEHHLIEVNAGASQSTLIDRYVPPGSCVIFDDAIQGIESNRLVSASSTCPVIVDSGGLSMAVGGRHPERSTTLDRVWRRDFLAAQYVVLAGLTPLGIPWTGTLYSWFVAHFHVVFNGLTYVIYRRD